MKKIIEIILIFLIKEHDVYQSMNRSGGQMMHGGYPNLFCIDVLDKVKVFRLFQPEVELSLFLFSHVNHASTRETDSLIIFLRSLSPSNRKCWRLIWDDRLIIAAAPPPPPTDGPTRTDSGEETSQGCLATPALLRIPTLYMVWCRCLDILSA